MFCPYCQRAVIQFEKAGDSDHRWCFIHLAEKKKIVGTPEEMRDAYYAMCEAHLPPKAKKHKIKLTPEQRNATVPCPLYW